MGGFHLSSDGLKSRLGQSPSASRGFGALMHMLPRESLKKGAKPCNFMHSGGKKQSVCSMVSSHNLKVCRQSKFFFV